ncbi:MAG TPA: type II toxin-antitoxin system RelE/ParE family toxin [Solirubrobacteraceae bacterium]|nr:type II toxin-antitoxin system RelE/ParE family toxin [Solirubrobacteraceae bacterium]
MARTAASAAAPDPGRRPSGRSGQIVSVPEFRRWMAGLDRDARSRVIALAQRVHADPARHHRPLVDTLKGSRMANLKELRVGPTARVLFARDPARNTVMLFGGDKAGQTRRFYREAVPRAERSYARHLNRIGKEAPWQHRNPPTRRPPSQER